MKRIILFAILAALLGSTIALPSQAVTGADWRAGNIIDDSVFYNKDAMGSGAIQAFFEAKVPQCDNWGTKMYGGVTRRAYAEARGEIFPLQCIKEYYENPVTHENNLQGRARPSGGMSAAEIIYAAAQGYGINPQVLVAILQKEQGLITDDWARFGQYKSAMGYGCPDTNLCNSKYYGFYNQVNNAARQFRIYANNPNGFNHIAGQVNNIRLSPIASCGTASVFIQNQATASLYNYTPYTPNQAALNDLYGNGDGCSAHGNRNFWLHFNGWFGSSFSDYSWQPINRRAFADNSLQTEVDLNNLGPGQRYYLMTVVKNTGNVTWRNTGDNQVTLGTTSPRNRASAFCDPSWLAPAPGCYRSGGLREGEVGPNQYGSFGFWVTTPNTPGTYNEAFMPISEGIAWMDNNIVTFPMTIRPPSYDASFVNQGVYTDANKQTAVDIKHLIPGARYFVSVSAKNTGNMAWRNTGANAAKLGTINSYNHDSPFCDASTWARCSRPATVREATVGTGQIGTFEFWITAPSAGTYTELYSIVVEGLSWIDSLPFVFNHMVEPYNWSGTGTGVYTDHTRRTRVDMNNLNPGQRYFVAMDFNNDGWGTWRPDGADPISLGTATPLNHTSAFCDPTWINCMRPARVNQAVAPRQGGSFEFWITAPTTGGDYVENFTPLIESRQWLGTNALSLRVRVAKPVYAWSVFSQTVFTSHTKTTPVTGSLASRTRYYVRVVFKNTGNIRWHSTGTNPVKLGPFNPHDRLSPFCDPTWGHCNRSAIIGEGSVAAGDYGSYDFWITTPSAAGTYHEAFAPVVEGVTWVTANPVTFPFVVR